MQLDAQALTRLRDALAEVKRHQGRQIPRPTLARLAAALPDDVAMTIDFDAAEQLGHPMVVLRPRAATPQGDPAFAELTPRQREVAGLVAAGLRNRDIALALGISLATVKDHVHGILERSGLDGRSAIAALWRP